MTSSDINQVLSRFIARNDRKGKYAYFRTNVPEVAPYAYLNILFEPVGDGVIQRVEKELGPIPEPLLQFYRQHNGALLLSSSIRINGLLPANVMMDRADPFSRVPFDVRNLAAYRSGTHFPFASYGALGEIVLLERVTGEVTAVDADSRKVIRTWPSFQQWLTGELERIASMYEDDGRYAGPPDGTSPRFAAGAESTTKRGARGKSKRPS